MKSPFAYYGGKTTLAAPALFETVNALDVIRDYGQHDEVLIYADPPLAATLFDPIAEATA